MAVKHKNMMNVVNEKRRDKRKELKQERIMK